MISPRAQAAFSRSRIRQNAGWMPWALSFTRTLASAATGMVFCVAISAASFGLAEEDRLVERGTVQFILTPDEGQIAERFRQKEHSFDWQAVRMRTVTDHLEVWDVTFPSPVVTPHAANNTVHCEYFQPRCPGRRPAVIVLHILGGDFPLSRLFCNALAQHGVAALFVKMPYYGPRADPETKRRMVSRDPRETVEGMTQAILDIRRATAWLASRPEVDDRQLGVFGISLGGITSSLAATAEPRLVNVCTLLAGGDISKVAWEAPDFREVREKWLASGGTKEQFIELVREIDPVTYAQAARGKRILMLNAADDELIPRVCTDSLWKALGEPEIHYYSGGHYTVIRHLISALDRVARFFAAVDGAADVRDIIRASRPMVIDGNLDEPAWKDATEVLVDRPHGRAGIIAEEPPMVARLAWDDDYLYLGYEVRDTDLVAIGAGRQVGPAGNRREASEEYLPEKNLDLVEFFISLGSPTEFWEMHHSAGNHLNNHWCIVPTAAELRKDGTPRYADVKFDRERFVPDDGSRTVARAVHLLPKADGKPSTVNDSSDIDAGFTGEIRFPWSGLGLPAETRKNKDGSLRLAGLELQILAAVLNGNDGEPRYWSSGELPKQMFHFSTSRWPRYSLK